jgi:hypothetical protein
MTLRAKHIELVEKVNNAKSEREHCAYQHRLDAWREGVLDAGVNLSLMAADQHYLDQGIDRPMCCGVFLDWKPS